MELNPFLALYTSASHSQPFWSLVHPFPQYYLLTSQRCTFQRFASQRCPVATSTQFHTMTSNYFFLFVHYLLFFEKDNHKGIRTCLCLNLDVHVSCSIKYLLTVQKCTWTNRTRLFFSCWEHQNTKATTFVFHADFWWYCWFQSPDSTFLRVAPIRPNGPNGHNGAVEHKTFLSCWEKAPKRTCIVSVSVSVSKFYFQDKENGNSWLG